MGERGMSLGMLFTGRIGFYERLGWHAWPLANALYIKRSDPPAPEPGLELGALDAWVQSRIAELPEDRRILVTAHDAFGYFGGPPLMSVLTCSHGKTSYPHLTYQGSRFASSPRHELRCGHGPHS